MKLTKTTYLQVFSLTVVALAAIRLVFIDPQHKKSCEEEMAEEMAVVDQPHDEVAEEDETTAALHQATPGDKVLDQDEVYPTNGDDDVKPVTESTIQESEPPAVAKPIGSSRFFNADGTIVRHRIYSVPSYVEAFPDTNAVQLVYAQRYGTKPVANRAEAEVRKADLVYIGSSPYYHVAPLGQSIPYLVPRAAMLLHDIGRAFYDSLQIKGVPLHQIVVSSVLRSDADVAKLRRRNTNATENSCHRFGTTFDISYVRYKTIANPNGPERRAVSNDTLKWVLSEVLNDMRNNGRCVIKYERKQPCFHITVK